MADARARLDQLNIVAGDLARSAAYYRRLGVRIGPLVRNAAGEAYHASAEAGAGLALKLDSPAFAPIWNEGWAGRDDLAGRVVIGFRLATRAAVDALYAELLAAGHRGLSPPCDAFWGARYAIVADPDGLAVGLMSPIDPARRTGPSEGWRT